MASADVRRIIVVGGSIAGVGTIDSLRRLGFAGDLVLVERQTHDPYDRPPLSKGLLTGAQRPEDIALRPEGHLTALGVETHLGVCATGLDPDKHLLETTVGSLGFDKMIVAGGCQAICLPGTEGMAGVHVLRSLDDGLAVREKLEHARRVVVIGAGFIGSEVASSGRSVGADVTLVDAHPKPLSGVVGAEAADRLLELHASHGVTVVVGTQVERLQGGRSVESVQLLDGSVLRADLVVVGVGVRPDTRWLMGSGLDLRDGVVCDHGLNTGHDDIFAAGDIASWFNRRYGSRMRVEHWTNAVAQGPAVARSVLSDAGPVPFEDVPYFWSDLYGHRIQSAGHMGESDQVDRVDLDDGELWLYSNGSELRAALAIDAARPFLDMRRLLARGARRDEAIRQART